MKTFLLNFFTVQIVHENRLCRKYLVKLLIQIDLRLLKVENTKSSSLDFNPHK